MTVDAGMPAHGHGMLSRPIVTPLGDGRFRVDGMLLHMPGYWEIVLEVKREGEVERVVVPITIEHGAGT